MSVKYLPSLNETKALDTEGLRRNFLLSGLFQSGEINFQYVDIDRAIVGAACPLDSELSLEATDDLRAEYFCQRRELGILNIGEAGVVTVDGESYEVGNLECLYVGRGSESVAFRNGDSGSSQFYFVSYPAHTTYPTTLYKKEDANRLELGSSATSNERVIYQYIHEGGIKSCQLVMGFTVLAEGSVWNTMPPHTHDRRSEVYLYFSVPEEQAVFHFMGQPQETRHVCVHDREAVLSPAWSIHAGCGTANYSFIWAMGGENQRFDDMDQAPVATLR